MGGGMPEEFEGDLAGAVFWGADLRGARFRDVNLTDAKISHAWLVNVDIDALVDKVVINGVDVTAYVNERDPWFPLRAMLRPSNPEGMRATWAALEDEWAKTITRAQALPKARCTSRSTTSGPSSRRCDISSSRWTSGSRRQSSENASSRRVAEHRLRRLPVARPRSRPDSVCLGSSRRARGPRHALSRLSRSVAATDFKRPIDVLENGTNPLKSASAPSLRKSSGTPATRSATSRNWRRRNKTRLAAAALVRALVGTAR